jgi:hypothetical protein
MENKHQQISTHSTNPFIVQKLAKHRLSHKKDTFAGPKNQTHLVFFGKIQKPHPFNIILQDSPRVPSPHFFKAL